jgi:outer membrane protein TolC
MIKLLRNFILLLLMALPPVKTMAQSPGLSLEDCYKIARENYPLIKKLDLIRKSSLFSLENAGKLYLPLVSVNGQATYQSQTVSFSDALGSVSLPGGFSLPNISKDQYKIQAEISQTIYDGGVVNSQRAVIQANEAVQNQNIEVVLYAVNDRVNQIFFAVLLIDEQLKQNEIRRSDLQGAADKTAASLKFGTAFRSNLDQLKAELINVDMVAIELKANRSAYLKMLGLLIGKELNDSTSLITPGSISSNRQIDRPEMKLYDFQKSLFDAEERKLKTDYMPKLSAFAQVAYGRPTLNFISNKFGPWYLLGARLNWNLGSLYTLKNNRQNLAISRSNVDADRETFLLNTSISMRQQEGDISKYAQLIAQDQKVIELRTSVKNSAQAQLENGVITTHDYISQLNAENQARQTLILHNIQLLQAQYKHKNITGN